MPHDSATPNLFFGTAPSEPMTGPPVSPQLPRVDHNWTPIKEPNGATHPGAATPFGMVSTAPFAFYGMPYERGYPSGYNGRDFFGFGHFNQSGTGTIRWYYNYLLVTPQAQLGLQPQKRRITAEEASPGRYACELDDGIVCESVATPRCVLHEFSFPKNTEPHLLVDASHAYLAHEEPHTPRERFPEQASIELVGANEGRGFVLMDGHPIYFHLRLSAADSMLLYDDARVTTNRRLELPSHRRDFGFRADLGRSGAQRVTVRIGFSFMSVEQAEANLALELPPSEPPYAVARRHAERWEAVFERIRVAGGREADRELFASCLYKASLKPVIAEDENPRSDGSPFIADFATVWDMASAQLPLLFTLHRERGRQLLDYFVRAYTRFGSYPPAVMMKPELPWVFSKQASLLGNIILADGFHKGYDLDWDAALGVMVDALDNERGEHYRAGRPLAPSITHNLDYSYASFCAATVARGLGREEPAARLLSEAGHWREMYDPDDGLLRVFPKEEHVVTDAYPAQWYHFYEGSRWTYSFRVWHNMRGLIEHVGRERFVRNLDLFFGLDDSNQPGEFQGLNNEPDYCAPYAYYYAGRPARAQQIVRTAMLYRYGIGRGGLPGNDDSGALSAWYVWNAIGLFPIAGQDVFLICSPMFRESTITVGERSFRIAADSPAPENAFVSGAVLNGEPLGRAYLHYRELAAGGTLELALTREPTGWGTEQPPPSFSDA
jgi:predicted alpha-1,2-mannosidase